MAKATRSKAARPGRRHAQVEGSRRAGSKSGGRHESATEVPAPVQARAMPPAMMPAPEAVSLFERGMAALQRHEYGRAADRFGALVSQFGSERALLDRARVYLGLCERELRRRPQAPTTPEEMLTAATAALNDDRDDDAERLAHRVLDAEPDHDLALYLLAAVHARRGEADTAIEWLARALDISPDIRAQVRHDADFDSLRELDVFRQLLDSPISAQSGTRRGRRLRSDR
jgi:tetratricopeptide (TPR) repeat protein